MSQTKVSEYFSTRKRNRLGQEDVLLNKQNKSQTVIDSPIKDDIAIIKNKIHALQQERSTRSKSKQIPQEQNEQNSQEEVPIKKTRGSTAQKKEQLEALKSRINRLDDKIARVVVDAKLDEQVKQPVEEDTKPEKKKRLNRAELKQKMEDFNRKLVAIQAKEAPEPAPVVQEPLPLIPAYLSMKDLASENIDMSSALTLPHKYARLLEFFKGSDSIEKMLFNRDEICTFLKLKMGIQNITKHTFTLQNLAQLKTVYPEAYIFKQEKLFIDFKNDFHLIISPNLDEIEVNPDNGLRQFTPNVLLKRLNKFKTNLFSIVKKLHQEFLHSIGIRDVHTEDIKRWHQKFDLENVPDIEATELPKPPTSESIQCKSGQELLSIAKNIYSSRIQEAIKATIEPLQNSVTIEPVKSEVPKVSPVEPHEQKKLSVDEQAMANLKQKKEASYNALLEKVRNKEKQKAFESMVVNSDKEKNLVRFSNYKDSIRFLLHFFQSEKKSTLEMDRCVKKMSESSKTGLTESECREIIMAMCSDDMQVNLFVEGAKKWLTKLTVRNTLYVQMNKEFELNKLHAICDKALEKLKATS